MDLINPKWPMSKETVSHFQILEPLGAGGMGRVYKAFDTKLRRTVALKFVAPELSEHPKAQRRLLWEARAAAALNHRNICTVYEVDEVQTDLRLDTGERMPAGTTFIAMELIAGAPLDRVLSESGPLPLDEVLSIAVQIAEGLAEAHSQGIVHRDLKPQNVVVTSSNQVKILDFGLAKPLTPGAPVDVATVTVPLTHEGVVAGTTPYMSPEQASGKDVDSRSDIFSFGVMLYEMLTGKRPFQGQTHTEVLGKIIGAEPAPLSETRSGLPQDLERILLRCLRKKPEERYNDTRDLVAALVDLHRETIAGKHPSARKPARPWLVAAGVSFVAAAAIFVLPRVLRTDSPPDTVHDVLPEARQLTYDGRVSKTVVSPDGQYLAYCIDNQRIMIKDLGGENALTISDSLQLVGELGWSPDGTRLAFAAILGEGGHGTYVVPRLGGSPQRVSRAVEYLAWSPDGTRIASWHLSWKHWGILLNDVVTGTADTLRPLPGPDEWLRGGDWSPNGKLLTLATDSGRGPSSIWVLNIKERTHVLTIADSVTVHTPRWGPGGEAIYYERAGDLFGIDVDPASGRAMGAPRRLLTLEGLKFSGECLYSSTADGKRLVYTKEVRHRNLFAVLPSGAGAEGRLTQLTSGTAAKHSPALSPDGLSVAFLMDSGDGWDVYRVPMSGGTPQRLTFGGMVFGSPSWSPTGDRLAILMQVGTSMRVAIIPASGGTPHIFPNTQVSTSGVVAWAPGRRIAYQVPGNRNFRLLDPATGDDAPLVQDESVGWIFSPEVSPQGTHVAVFWNRKDPGLWVISLEDDSQTLLAKGRWTPVGWSADGRSIYAAPNLNYEVSSENPFKRFPLSGGEGEVVQIPPKAEEMSCLPYESPHGIIWLCMSGESFSDAWMIENFDRESR